MLKVFTNKELINVIIDSYKASNLSIGFVPTMGALHQGHLALVKKALDNNDKVVVSIFVNPTQFDNALDLKKYPRTIDNDIKLLESLNEDRIDVYTPTVEDIYQEKIVSEKFDFDGLDVEMEGKFRNGHFNGVGTVVKRFFEIIKPNNAYFGEKDFQQLAIINNMVKKHNIPVKIIGCPIYREVSGLALSSRNMRLKSKYKKAAPIIYETLRAVKEHFETKSVKEVTNWVNKQFLKHDLFKIEYFTIAETDTLKQVKRKSTNKTYRAFIAVYADDIRLIDNIALN